MIFSLESVDGIYPALPLLLLDLYHFDPPVKKDQPPLLSKSCILLADLAPTYPRSQLGLSQLQVTTSALNNACSGQFRCVFRWSTVKGGSRPVVHS